MIRIPVLKFLHMGMVSLLILAFIIGIAGTKPAQAANSTNGVSAGWMPFSASLPDTNININGRLMPTTVLFSAFKRKTDRLPIMPDPYPKMGCFGVYL